MPSRTPQPPPATALRYTTPATLDTLDQSAIFLAYLTFMGDIQQTALATETPVHLVAQLEAREDWKSKLTNLQLFKDKGDAGGFELAVNRTMNFVQAVRLRKLVDIALRELTKDTDPQRVMDTFTSTNKGGDTVLSMRPLMDLVKAAETAQHLTYRALGDHSDVGIGATATKTPESQALAMRRVLETLDEIPGASATAVVRRELTELSGHEVECRQDPRGRALDETVKLLEKEKK